MNVEQRRVSLEKSQAQLRRALQVIPGASQTFSKAPAQYVQGACPVFLQRGQGSHVWDVDGDEYIDSRFEEHPRRVACVILEPVGVEEPRNHFLQEVARRGIFFLTGFNVCFSLSDGDVQQTLGACEEALGVLARARERGNLKSLLEGPPVEPVFRSALKR